MQRDISSAIKDLADHLIADSQRWLTVWLPGGKREGAEWVVRNPTRDDKKLGSFKINVNNGKWSDFHTGDKGGDLVALFYYLNQGKFKNMAAAANDLCSQAGLPPITGPRPQGIALGAEHYAYHDEDGAVIAYMDFRRTEGRKDIYPWTKNNQGAWIKKGLAVPRPLFNLHLLAGRKGAPVVIVEGEKTATAAQIVLGDKAVVSTSPNGSQAAKKASWLPLKGRNVFIIPDDDSPGRAYARQVAEILLSPQVNANVVRICDPGGMGGKGWDIADWTPEDGSAAVLLGFLSDLFHNGVPLDKYKPPLSSEKNTPGQIVAEAKAVEPPIALAHTSDYPFRCLGMSQTMDRKTIYYYLQSMENSTIHALSERNLRKPEYLLPVVPDLEFWATEFPAKKETADWDKAATMIRLECLRISKARGLLDIESQVKGRGLWKIGEEKYAFHTGNSVIIGDEQFTPAQVDSEFIFEKKPALMKLNREPEALSDKDALEFSRICCDLRWRYDLYGPLFAGWNVVAPFCGLLQHRPHIWVSGASGTGKSEIQRNITMPATKGFSEVLIGITTSEPGIRRALSSDARPLLLDEGEPGEFNDMGRMKKILNYARASASETGGKIKLGDNSVFHPRGTFCFSSIVPAANSTADQSRITTLTLAPLPDDDEEKEKAAQNWEDLSARMTKLLDDDFSQKMFWRTWNHLAILEHNIAMFKKALVRRSGIARNADQLAPMFAGHYLLNSLRAIKTTEEAEQWIVQFPQDALALTIAEKDEQLFINSLLAQKIRYLSGGHQRERHIGDMLRDMAFNYGGKDFIFYDGDGIADHEATRAMHTAGVKLLQGKDGIRLGVATRTPELQRFFRGTAFEAGWAPLLRNISGAKEEGSIRMGSSQSRVVSIPISKVFPEGLGDEAPRNQYLKAVS